MAAMVTSSQRALTADTSLSPDDAMRLLPSEVEVFAVVDEHAELLCLEVSLPALMSWGARQTVLDVIATAVRSRLEPYVAHAVDAALSADEHSGVVQLVPGAWQIPEIQRINLAMLEVDDVDARRRIRG